MSNGNVRFSGKSIALAGVLVAGGIAIGVPALVLTLGAGLGAGVQTALITLAMLFGGVLGVVAAFFGIVIPTQVAGHDYSHWGRRHVKVTKDGDRKVVEINGEPVAAEEEEPANAPAEPAEPAP